MTRVLRRGVLLHLCTCLVSEHRTKDPLYPHISQSDYTLSFHLMTIRVHGDLPISYMRCTLPQTSPSQDNIDYSISDKTGLIGSGNSQVPYPRLGTRPAPATLPTDPRTWKVNPMGILISMLLEILEDLAGRRMSRLKRWRQKRHAKVAGRCKKNKNGYIKCILRVIRLVCKPLFQNHPARGAVLAVCKIPNHGRRKNRDTC